jgi:hypothetical protein
MIQGMKPRTLLWAFLLLGVLHHEIAAQPTTTPVDDEAQQIEQEMQAARFRMPLRVVGTVTDGQTSQPVPRFFVVPGSTDYEILQYSDVQECKDGKYEWLNDAPLPGRFVRIEAEGYAPMTSPVLSEHIVATFDAKLTKAPNISGSVTTPEGKPAARARVMMATPKTRIVLQNEDPAPGIWGASSAQTDPEGRFSLRPTDGPYRLYVSHESGCAEVLGSQLSADQALKLRPWGRIEGIVKVGPSPAAGERVTAYRLPEQDSDATVLQRSYETVANDEGRFVLEKVAPGTVTLGRIVEVQQAPGMSLRTHTNTQRTIVKAGETAKVQIGGTGRPVVGRLVLPGGIPDDWYIFEARLSTESQPGRGDGSGHFGIVPKADGSFRIEDVEPGKYTLSFTFSTTSGAQPYQPVASATRTVAVPQMPGGRSDEPLDLGEIAVTRQ